MQNRFLFNGNRLAYLVIGNVEGAVKSPITNVFPQIVQGRHHRIADGAQRQLIGTLQFNILFSKPFYFGILDYTLAFANIHEAV
ncbi:MAG: hypothetical protein ACE15F_17340 [bacterium]